jgi:hypothetical protein
MYRTHEIPLITSGLGPGIPYFEQDDTEGYPNTPSLVEMRLVWVVKVGQ